MANYWLMKTEPTTYSIDDLVAEPDQTTCWEGVRNYQARNLLRDEIKLGDHVLLYHSACKEPAVVGTAVVVRPGYPDSHALDRRSKYHDPKSNSDDPRWILVDVKFKRDLKRVLSLTEIKQHADALGDFALVRKGNRLSIMPVAEEQWDYLLGLERQ